MDSLGYELCESGRPVNLQNNSDLRTHDDGCRLVLGLGPTPNFYSADYNPTMLTKPKESATAFSWSVSGADFGMLELGLSRGSSNTVPAVIQNSCQTESPSTEKRMHVPIVDEGSTSAKRKSGGYMPTLLFAPRLENVSGFKTPTEAGKLLDVASDATIHHHHRHHYHVLNHQFQFSPETSAATDGSVGGTTDPLVTGSPADQRANHHQSKKCRFNGCSKGARGSSGLCIAHGGGQRCQKPGCNKGAESRAAYCKAHGGGRRCQQLGCTKSAEGKTDFCIAHGGGRRCGHPGCSKAARGKSGLCIRHGGGKRCTVEGCTKSAEGQAGRCISHGGGRRCQYQGCGKGAQGSTMYCKAHGGGKRCIFEGCNKGAEGSTPLCKGHGGGKRCLFEGGGVCPKSVHGGTNFCVAHGGGKRCAMPGCTKSARGRTDCCVRHGGGKRCTSEGCGKSAQGSTDFCKAHGGGKRCTWAMGCEKFARGKSGLCAAHGSLMVSPRECEVGNVGSMIGSDLFRGIVSTSTAPGNSKDNELSSSGVSSLSDCIESLDSMGSEQHLIPPQVLVPISMQSSSYAFGLIGGGREEGESQDKSFGLVIPEGRVHGGGLMSLLAGNVKNAIGGGKVSLPRIIRDCWIRTTAVLKTPSLLPPAALNRLLDPKRNVFHVEVAGIVSSAPKEKLCFRGAASPSKMVFWEGYVSDELTGTLAPIVVYWLYAGMYQLLPPLDQYRLHTRKEEEQKNLVPLSSVIKGVLLQQLVQATVAGLMFLVTAKPSIAGSLIQPPVHVQLIQILVAMFIMDTWQYFIHRYMHQNKFLYRHVHSQHHRLVVPYAIGALYNHPLEGLLLDTFGGAISFLISGMTARTSVFFFCFAVIKTVDDHCGLWLPGNIFHVIFQNNTAYHDIHHQLQGTKYNYSQPFFSIWDRILGTYMPFSLVTRQEGGYEARILKKTS
ncbi:unnamed protein product [Musa hybrid cultivar]